MFKQLQKLGKSFMLPIAILLSRVSLGIGEPYRMRIRFIRF